MGSRRKSTPPPGAFWVAEGGHRPRFADSGGNVYKEATNNFYTVIGLMFPEVDERTLSVNASRSIKELLPNLKQFYPRGIRAAIRTAPPEQRDAMNVLFLTVCDAIEAAHQAGIERGKSLLVQLASGGLTTKEFNDAVIKGEEE